MLTDVARGLGHIDAMTHLLLDIPTENYRRVIVNYSYRQFPSAKHFTSTVTFFRWYIYVGEARFM